MAKVSTIVTSKRCSDMVARAAYWENRIDADDARKALAEMKAKGDKPIPLSKVKKRLGP
jgi:hypothetical protein